MLRRGRFEKKMDERLARYTSSLEEDARIFRQVVKVNIAHVVMLCERKIITEEDASKILSALLKLLGTPYSKLRLRPELEDVHMVVEDFVAKEAGEAGGKLHTAKSRNDQVAAAIKLQAKEEILDLAETLLNLTSVLTEKAKDAAEVLMPGYTHLQVGEPTTFGHYLLAYVRAFLRDLDRLVHAYRGLNSSPMGACAFAGTGFEIDRKRVAELLGFEKIDRNTMDAVSSRDWLLEVMAASAIVMTNLSRLSEDMIIWSSSEFGFVDLPEEACSTSSIMPQKKNPVVFETIRAKTAEVIGLLSGALSLLKALPQSYNLDLQELTPMLWRTLDETKDAITASSVAIRGLKVRPERMRESIRRGFATITDLANELVRSKGLSFRQAHAVAGRIVLNAVREGKSLDEINQEDIARASQEVLGERIELSREILDGILDPMKVLRARRVEGGPSPAAVRREAERSRREIQILRRKVLREKEKMMEKEKKLIERAREICR